VSKKNVKSQQNTEVNTTSKQHTDHDDEDTIKIKELNITFKTDSQKELWDLIENKEIVICAGESGTGKSFLSLFKALDLMKNYPKQYKKIIITTPVKEADGESMGYLPGGIEEKLAPYTYSSIYLLKKILGDVKVDRMLKAKRIEIIALAYLRGVNIDNAILICDEAQNLTKKTMKTLLTRIGENAKFILNGDLNQSDRVDDHTKSGMYDALNKLKDIPQIGLFQFKKEDIVRNPVIGIILERLNEK